jgi:hypothetical protein
VIGVKAPPNYDRLAESLRTWSEFHVRTKILDHYAQQYLQDALARSDAELSPLAEPLKLNLGEHRWLSADREESYSDWLAWILQGISDSTEILLLFALSDEANGELLGPVGKIRREVSSEHGRTDIEVPIGKRGLLLIEVKVRTTGSSLPSQLDRYAKKVACKNVDRSLLVLLGTEVPDASLDLFGFAFANWEALCRRLRQYANRIKKSDLLRAAAILIFCGAVEQNLLGFSCSPKHFRVMATVNYLRDWRYEA